MEGLVSGLCPPLGPIELREFLPEAGQRNGASVLVLPGGGYCNLEDPKEGADVAQAFQSWGYAAYVLHYRMEVVHHVRMLGRKAAKGVEPMVKDGILALRHIRQRAHELDLDERRLAVIGFSAGGHLATCICRAIAERNDLACVGDGLTMMPKAIVLAYAPARSPCCACIGGGVFPGYPLRGFPCAWHCRATGQHRWCQPELTASALAAHSTRALVVQSTHDFLLPPGRNGNVINLALEREGVETTYLCENFGNHGFVLEGWASRCRDWLANHV
jgi:acetyl esterase/lipase